MDSISEEMEPSFFEIITAMAMVQFRERKVDVAVFEVGMGGRFDATSLVNPDVCTITNVALDHTKALGDTLGKIAFEKSGIIKDGVQVVTGAESEEVLQVIRDESQKHDSKLTVLNEDFGYKNEHLNINKNEFDFWSIGFNAETNVVKDVVLNLNGRHQLKNASVAIETYKKFCEVNSMEFDKYGIYSALKDVIWAGRMEVVNFEPLVVVDGAHNPQGVDMLVDNWMEYFDDEKVILLTGMLSDKNYAPMIEKLSSIADKIVVTEPNSPRDTDTKLIVDSYILNIGKENVFYEKDHKKACKWAFDLSHMVEKPGGEEKTDRPILITGSLYVIGYLKEIILNGLR